MRKAVYVPFFFGLKKLHYCGFSCGRP